MINQLAIPARQQGKSLASEIERFTQDLIVLAKSELGMPHGIAHEYAQSWSPFFKPGMTAQDAIKRDITKIGNPNKVVKLKKKGGRNGDS